MKKLAEIEPIKLLGQFVEEKNYQLVLTLAKKYLSEDICLLRQGDTFRFAAWLIIAYILSQNQEILDLKQICQHCPLAKHDCKTTH